MNQSLVSKVLYSTAVVAALLAVPGCGFLNQSTDELSDCQTCKITNDKLEGERQTQIDAQPELTGDVLVSIAGKPVMTAESFEKDLVIIAEANPQVKQLLELFPDIKDKIFEGLLNQQIIDVYVDKNKLNETNDYKKQLENIVKSAKQMLNDSVFTKTIASVTVSDSEARNYYEKNKSSIPELIISRGGVMSKGVSFADEEKARAFAQRAKTKPADFEALAKEEGLAANFKDFKLVNAESIALDGAVRNKLLTLTTFPAVETVKGSDGMYWVVAATGKEEAKYQPFEQIVEGLKQAMLQEKQHEVKQSKLDALKKEYNVQINQVYFEKNKEQQKNERIEKIQEAIQEQQNAQNESKQKQPVKQQRAA